MEGTRNHKLLTLTNYFCNELSDAVLENDPRQFFLAEQMQCVMSLVLDKNKTIPFIFEEQYKALVIC